MTVLQWTKFGAVLVMAMTMANGQLNVTELESTTTEVWCPQHTRSVWDNTSEYRQCEPHECIYFNDNYTEVIEYHEGNFACSGLKPEVVFLSPSCRWVRLRKDDHFRFNLPNGSIYEMKTNVTHQLGSYIYNSELKEAIICRQKALPGDDTRDITLWCNSHTINTNGPPKIHKNGTLNVPQLNVTLRKGLYRVYTEKCNETSCMIAVCLNTSLDFLKCESTTPLDNNGTPFEVLSNLSLLVKWDLRNELYPVGQYYLKSDHKSANVCVKVSEQSDRFSDNTYPLYVVSAIFCLFTLLAHLFFPKLNYHAKALLCHVFSMMVMYVCLTIKRFHFYVESESGRFSLFIFYYVSALSTYLWLSVIAYEVWKVFANLRGSARVLETEREKKRWFAVKCGYAWGTPLVICFFVIGLAHNPKAAHLFQVDLVTRKATFFATFKSIFVFLYGPAIVILLANMVFFGLTIWTIRQVSTCKTKSISKKSSRNLLYLSMKLFVVMGMSWVADVISFGVGGGSGGRVVLYVSDVVNGLQGVAVFLVYVCKKSTWRTMMTKCGATHVHEPTSETKTSELSRGRLASVDAQLHDEHRNKPSPNAEAPLDTVDE